MIKDFEILLVPDFSESEAKECLEFYSHEKLIASK